MPRKAKHLTDVRSLARQKTDKAIATLAGIMSQPKAPAAARVAAAQALLDRGWGRATQPVSGPDEGPIIAEIRRVIVDSANQDG